MNLIRSTALLMSLAVPSIAQTAAPKPPADPLHAWVGMTTPADLENWVNYHIAEEKKAVAEILAVKGTRTIENTLKPFDRAQFHLNIAGNQDYLMFGLHDNKDVRDKAQALLQNISAEGTALQLNQDVYHALVAVDKTKADAATRYYLDRTLLEYRLAGVDKDADTREKVRKLSDQITEQSLHFSRTVQDDVRKVVVKDPADLDGLPADYIEKHKPAADGTITLTTDQPDMLPVVTYAKNPRLRRDMYLAYNNRAFPGNKAVLLDLMKTRQEMATTLGYKTWADLATADMMIGSADKLRSFLKEVDEASRPAAAKEFALLEAFVKEKEPSALPLAASDSSYWSEQYRRARYDFDSQSVRPYFPYPEVEKGVLATAGKLFHIEFRPSKAPIWNPTVTAYDVYDQGKLAGRIYLDMHPREGKDKWFSESGVIPGSGSQIPEAALLCNFPGPENGDPGLLQYSDVVTFFHEFGHMMHEVLGGHGQWAGTAGVSTERDFVEAPSQMLEEFFEDTGILQSFARHYKTGEVLPSTTIDKMVRAGRFARGSWVQGQLRYSELSLSVHDRAPEQVDLDAINKKTFVDHMPYVFLDDSHMYASFTHLTGYSSNYYTYVLDKVIAVDLFSAFDPKNLLGGPAAMKYRKTVLEPGGNKSANDLIKDFLGRPQSMDALKRWIALGLPAQ
ncbi:M3 family metallopeptidase [Terriglobus sp. 2YAB30_2]|uniref:M3 family metallopeptidase n=1 Tax=Terriglobus sp. 2YAB30_2 TaxID=3233023 RepID=UPI003F98E1BD